MTKLIPCDSNDVALIGFQRALLPVYCVPHNEAGPACACACGESLRKNVSFNLTLVESERQQCATIGNLVGAFWL